MQAVQPSNENLQELLRDIDSGRLQLPNFQRDFRWTSKRIKDLLETIQLNHPTGALLFLKTPRSHPSPFGQVLFKYAAPAQPVDAENLVLDGQQRLTSCYIALFNKGEPRPKRDLSFFVDLRKLFVEHIQHGASGEIDFASCIVTKPWDPVPAKYLPSDHLLPLSALRTGEVKNQPHEFLNDALSGYKQAISQTEADTPYFDFIDKGTASGYLVSFFNYAFPVINLPADLSVAAVCKIFETINSRGLRLSAFDLCVASLSPKNISLKDLWTEAKKDSRIRSLDKDGTNILQTIALMSPGASSKKAELPTVLPKLDVAKLWTQAVEALQDAADFLGQYGAGLPPKREFVPYDGILPPLATILRNIKQEKMSESARAAAHKVIIRWYFTSALGQRYNEGTDVLQDRDRKQIVDFVMGVAVQLPEGLEVQGWSPSIWSTASPAGAIGRALRCGLNHQAPKGWLSHGLVGGGSGAGPTDLHHIFPRAFLKKKGLSDDKRINSVLNQTFLSPATNRVIGRDAPSVYVPSLIAELSKDSPKGTNAISTLRANMAAHLIDGEAFAALEADDFEGFLVARAKAFASTFADQFGVILRDLSAEPEAEEELLSRSEDADLSADEEAEAEFSEPGLEYNSAAG